MKLLVIGDPHVTVEELSDCNHLIDCIEEVVVDNPVDGIVFLGDLHHNHALVRIEVLAFWRKAFERLQKYGFIYLLVGNHDRSHDVSLKTNALEGYDSDARITVVSEPQYLSTGIVLAPWYADGAKLAEDLKKFPGTTLICHQTFDGSKYENGFYAKDGVDPKLFDYRLIISGHIHAPQQFSNVWYVGAPRWRIASDANVDRFIVLMEFDSTGILTTSTSYKTDPHCKRIVHLVDREEEPLSYFEVAYKKNISLRVDIHGSTAWVDERRKRWEECGARVASFPVVARSTIVRESEGINVALQRFVNGWVPKNGTSIDVLKQMVAERVKL